MNGCCPTRGEEPILVDLNLNKAQDLREITLRVECLVLSDADLFEVIPRSLGNR